MNRTDGWIPWGDEKDIECANLLMQLESVRYDLKMEREYIAILQADADQLRAEHAHEREMTQREIARLSTPALGMVQYDLENALKENARLRAELDKCQEALKFYADDKNWQNHLVEEENGLTEWPYSSDAINDQGETARKVLENEK